MIHCPFCNAEVKDPTDQKPVEDDHANNYYCPSYVEIRRPTQEDAVGKRLCHFSRRQLSYLVDGATAYSYQAVMPPFQITWITNKAVCVFKLNSEGDRKSQTPIYQSKSGGLYKDFLKTCHRFKALVPFL